MQGNTNIISCLLDPALSYLNKTTQIKLNSGMQEILRCFLHSFFHILNSLNL